MEIATQLSTAPTGTQWTISGGGHSAAVVEVGGGLRAYRAGEFEIISGYAEDELPVGSAGQLLAPWPNRIRDGRYTFGGESHQLPLTEVPRHNAIHGLVNWVRWTPVEVGETSVTLTHDLVPQPGYPWPLHLWTTWSVSEAGLRADHLVRNVGGEPAPFGFSVHPYLQVPGVPVDDLTLTVPGHTRLLLDNRLLPIGAAKVAGSEFDFVEGRRIGGTVLDVAFGDIDRDADGGSHVTVAGPGGESAIIWADERFGWWQVFSSDTLPGDRFRAALAIEPMTCPPDAFRSGKDLITLAPGEEWTGSWGIRPA